MPLKNVLVVDRSLIHLRLVKLILSERYAVHTAADGPQALAIAEASAIDLVLLSMRLPGMDGCELARALKSRENMQRTPIVAVSGSDSRDDMLRARDAGVVWWIPKPIHGATLCAIVASLVESAPEGAEGRGAARNPYGALAPLSLLYQDNDRAAELS